MVPVATACADSTDFTTEDGRLKLSPHSAQNNVETFTFTLDGDQNTFEKVVPFDDVTIPVTGWYFVSWDAHANALITRATAGTVVSASAVAQLRVNNVVVDGTETMLQLNSQGAPLTTEPVLQLHGSGSGSRNLFLNAGAKLSLWAKRNSDPGTTTEIISDTNGRCRITAFRFGGN